MPDAAEIKSSFDVAREGANGWQIRYGAEPIDLHLFGKGTRVDKALERIGITAGIGGSFNHNYIEIMNPDGDVVKRIHGLGLDPKDGKLEMTGGGRLIGLTIDGKYTDFSQDPVQHDDPHETKPHNLQHADTKNWFGEDATKIVFKGSEREVMEIYGAMLRGSIEINNQDIKFDLFGLNSNTFNAEMKEKVQQIATKMGVTVESHDPSGIDIGSDDGKISTLEASRVKTWGTMQELRDYIDTLEQTSHEQWLALNRESLQNGKEITSIDLNTRIPGPR
jgi:hypothetical protein